MGKIKLPGRSAGDTRCELYVAQCSSAHTKFCDGRGGANPIDRPDGGKARLPPWIRHCVSGFT